MSPRARLVDQPIDVGGLIGAVSRPANGAILLFLGLVRDVNQGRGVTGIEYSAYEAMAARELTAIVDEAGDRFDVEDLVVEHRLGQLAIEEASVGIAVAHAHRAEVYDVSRWVIEELKRRVPIWKRELYVDGTREWVNAGTGAATSPGGP
jgi:molybdopterin synthase catalytic subunit